MTKKVDSKVALLIFAAIVLLALIFLVYIFEGPQSPASSVAGQSAQPSPSYAPQGELASGFPASLVLDSNASITKSYSLNYSATDNLYTAIWNSSSSASALFATYKNYFTQNGWTITNQVSYAAFDAIAGQNSSSIVTATFVPQGSASQITIGYVPKTSQ